MLHSRPFLASTHFRPPLFAFDLDGTITRAEMLPRLGARLAAIAGDPALEDEIAGLTARTLNGEIAFAESFRRRFAILKHLPLAEVWAVAAALPLDEDIAGFIRKNRDDCAVVTGNLDYWIKPVMDKLGCRLFSSKGLLGGDGVLELGGILDKAEAMRALKATGRPVLAIGESAGDIAMFRESDYSIAFAGLHEPAPALLALADRVVTSGAELCAFLESCKYPATP